MSEFDFSALVTDRSAEDVQKWKEYKSLGLSGMSSAQLAEWRSGMKGTYNAADLNRVSACMEYLRELLEGLGYSVPGYAQQGITWTDSSTPTAGQLAQYLANVQALRDVIAEAQFSADLPQSMVVLTYVGANAVEQILTEINAYLSAMQAVFLRSGMTWATAGSPGFYFAN